MATLTADNKGRITLGLPAREGWLWTNETALRAVRDGLNQVADRKLAKGPNLEADAKLVAKLNN